MSRLSLGLVALAVLYASAGCMKKQMSGKVRFRGIDALKIFEKSKNAMERMDRDFRDALAQDPKLTKRHPAAKEAQRIIERTRKNWQKLLADGRKLKRYVRENDKKREKVAWKLSLTVEKDSKELESDAAQALKMLLGLLDAKRRAPAIAKQVVADVADASGIPSAELAKEVAEAGNKLPAIRQNLIQRVEALRRKAKTVADLAKAFQKENTLPSMDYVKTARRADKIHRLVDGLQKAAKKLRAGLGDLHFSEDRILIDMRKNDGLKFVHRYKVIKDCQATTSDWLEVPITVYSEHRGHLGMSLYSKPRGVMSSEATTFATPPGYVYVGNPIYGTWKESKWVTRHWNFRKAYGCLVKLLWGKDYTAVQHKDYLAFVKARKLGKVWVGDSGVKGPRYGTHGGRTTRRYKQYYVRESALIKQARLKRATELREMRLRSLRTGGGGRSGYGGYGK